MFCFMFVIRSRSARCALVPGVQSCALPISGGGLAPGQLGAIVRTRRRWRGGIVEIGDGHEIGTHRGIIGISRDPFLDLGIVEDAALVEIDRDHLADRKSTRLNSRHYCASPMPSSA